jgi:hypothetical protein
MVGWRDELEAEGQCSTVEKRGCIGRDVVDGGVDFRREGGSVEA